MSGLGWDADGLCDDHNRFGCEACRMTPNPNPSPELLPCPSGHTKTSRNNNNIYGAWWVQCADGECSWRTAGDTEAEAIAAWNTRALSPQTLPAPGEVEDVRKRAQSIWDKRWFCIEGEWSPDEEPIETDEPRRFAEIAIAALTPTLATVAAANDEGVCFVAGPIWQETEEDHECWTAEIQTIGGHNVIATVHGASRDEASQRQSAVMHALATSRSQHEGASS